MKIALVTTPFDFFATGFENIAEPLGLLYIASTLGIQHDVFILDAFAEGYDVQKIIEKISEIDPDIVGISTVFSVAISNGIAIAKEIKRKKPSIKIAFGGTHASFTAQSLIREPFVDIVFLGESEYSFKSWIEGMNSHSDKEGVPGSVVLHDGKIKKDPAGTIKDLDGIPFPARKLCPPPKEIINPSASVITARGCPFGCIYCSSSGFFGHQYRARTAANIISEIEEILCDFGYIKTISFADDLFTFDKNRVQDFCNLLLEKDLHTEWGCSTRIELIDPPLIELMGKAGCTRIFFGVESGSDRVLQKMNRNYTVSSVKSICKICLEHGIIPIASFMVGTPYEMRDDVKKTIELMETISTPQLRVFIFTVYPGTPVHESPERYGIKIVSEILKYSSMSSRCAHSTRYLECEEIDRLFKEALGCCQKRAMEKDHFKKLIKVKGN